MNEGYFKLSYEELARFLDLPENTEIVIIQSEAPHNIANKEIVIAVSGPDLPRFIPGTATAKVEPIWATDDSDGKGNRSFIGWQTLDKVD